MRSDSRRTCSRLSPTRSLTCSPVPPKLSPSLLQPTMLTLHANVGARTCTRFYKAYRMAVELPRVVRRVRRNRNWLRSGRRRGCGMVVPEARSKIRCSICDSRCPSCPHYFFVPPSCSLRLLIRQCFSFFPLHLIDRCLLSLPRERAGSYLDLYSTTTTHVTS